MRTRIFVFTIIGTTTLAIAPVSGGVGGGGGGGGGGIISLGEVQSIAGLSGPTDAVTPFPDLATTVGPDDILELSTGRVVVRSLDGSAIAVDETSEQFWTAAGITGTPNAFEHSALYDPVTARFFVTADEHVAGANRRYLAVSASNSAAGEWNAVALSGSAAVLGTRVGIDARGLYVTGDPGDGTTSVITIPMADVLSLSQVNATTATFPAAGIIPAVYPQGDFYTGNSFSLFARRGSGENGHTVIEIWTAADPFDPFGRIDLGSAFPPPPATAMQPNGPALPVGDGRLASFIVNGPDQMYGIAETEVDGHAAALWFFGGLGGQGMQTGTLAFPDTDVIAPSLTSANGDSIGMAAEQTSATQPPRGLISVASFSTTDFGATTAFTVGSAPAPGCGSATTTAFGRTTAIAAVQPGTSGPAAEYLADTMGVAGAAPACGFVTELDYFNLLDEPLPASDSPAGLGGAQAQGCTCAAGHGAPDAGGVVLAALTVAAARRRRRRA